MEVVSVDAYKFNTLEEYIKTESRHYYNLSYRGIKNSEIKQFCESKGIKVKSRDKRNDMLDKLFETDEYVMEFYEEFKEYICVSFFDYSERFGISKSQYNQLKKANFFEIDGYFEVKARYGWITVPALSAKQFFNMTQEEINLALNNNQESLF